MFKITNGDGLIYISESGKTYDLLEGICSNGLTSDIIFIVDRMANNGVGKVVNFIYGGFDHLQEEGIKNYIEDYEKQKEIKK